MAAGSRFSFADLQNPLFLHPSDGPTSVTVPKLQGAEDYRAWRRSIEIQLASKRKLGFVNGSEHRSTTDAIDAVQWDTCNNMVISWLHNNISDSIKKSILFVNSASDVWKLLEKRFQLTNGSCKYKLNRDLFSVKQNGLSLVEYFTMLSSIWEEIDAMTVLPVITHITDEIRAFLTVLEVQKQESRLFQFLNGLDECYASQRSQLLMLDPLPTVDVACSVIQQEESQRKTLNENSSHEIAALYSNVQKTTGHKPVVCSECGRKGHVATDCWSVIGYPKWHNKHKKNGNASTQGLTNNSSKWNQNKSTKMVNVAQNCDVAQQSEHADNNVVMISKQLEQLLKLLPSVPSLATDELDAPFSGMVSANIQSTSVHNSSATEWIIDSGATDHMTSNLSLLSNVKVAPAQYTIALPTGDSALITHVGDVLLASGLKLLGVLYVPTFNHNLLSIHKLACDNRCHIMFLPDKCVIQNSITSKVQGEGLLRNGLYYLTCDISRPCINSAYGASFDNASFKDSYEMWHNRLGHAPATKIKLIPQLKTKVKYSENKVCITCPLARFTNVPLSLSNSHASECFDLVHADIWGPYRVCTRQKYKFFLTLVDDCTRMVWVYLLQYKSEFLSVFKCFLHYIDTHFSRTIKVLRTDNALEFKDTACVQLYSTIGLLHQTSCVYKPQQNARVERKHRYILEMARALKLQSGLSINHWGECVLTAVYTMNRLPSSVLKNVSPYETLYGDPPDYEDFKAFGCLAFCASTSTKGDKFQNRGVPCVFIGYPPSNKGYRLLTLADNSIIISRDVLFQEQIFPYNDAMSTAGYMSPVPISLPSSPSVAWDYDMFVPASDDNASHTSTADSADNSHTSHTSPAVTRQSTRVRTQPTWMADYAANFTTTNVIDQCVTPQFSCFLTTLTAVADPTSFKQAVKHQHWIDAMNCELDALERNGTWEITTLPPGKQAIGCQWLFKTKFKADGTIDRFKSRLVVLGCKQQQGVDYGETFAPVAKMATVRTLLAVAALKNWIAIQMDVTNAFLYGHLNEEVYMSLPQGYTGIGSRIGGTQQAVLDVTSRTPGSRLVCKLIKSLYGLKQAPRCWFSKLTSVLKADGYQQSRADYSLLTKIEENKITVILVYVDDLLITGDSQCNIDKLKAMLSRNFHMKDLGNINYFLGIEVHRSPDGFFLSQRKYVLDLLKEYHMVGVKPSKLPMNSKLKLAPTKGVPLQEIQPYQRLLGKLIYLTVTRPDIVYSVHILTQYMQAPTSDHMQAAKKLLRYLAGNPGQGILLASTSAAQLTAYCDSDWAGCEFSRRSTTGYCILLGSSPVSWKTKKQSVVARSTAEAEYRAMAMASCEVTWLSALLQDMGLQNLPSTVLNCDNQAALSIAANPVSHERTKHVEIDCHFIRDKIAAGEIVPQHVPSYAQLADMFTKQLASSQHMYLLRKLGVSSAPATHTAFEGE